jgi:hypothetical protein
MRLVGGKEMTDAEMERLADAVASEIIKSAAESVMVVCAVVGLTLAAILWVGNWLGKIK